jgi:hypothetical protein
MDAEALHKFGATDSPELLAQETKSQLFETISQTLDKIADGGACVGEQETLVQVSCSIGVKTIRRRHGPLPDSKLRVFLTSSVIILAVS